MHFQGIAECVIVSVVPIASMFFVANNMAFTSRTIFGVAWGWQPTSGRKREATLARVQKYAAELASDIDKVTKES